MKWTATFKKNVNGVITEGKVEDGDYWDYALLSSVLGQKDYEMYELLETLTEIIEENKQLKVDPDFHEEILNVCDAETGKLLTTYSNFIIVLAPAEPAELKLGLKGRAETVVDNSNIASTVGSGLLDVFSTPNMIALMEKAASNCLLPYLESGQGTVGIQMEVSHLAATPIGAKVWAECELIEMDKRIFTFRVEAYSEKEKIGEGIHKRCLINNDHFLEKMNAKYHM